jgi:hypothetical protein
LETDCRRCCACMLCGLLCCLRAQGEFVRESVRCGYRRLSSPALCHIGFTAGDRYRLPNLETFSQYEVDSCSVDISSHYICNCDHSGVLGPCRISPGDTPCLRTAWEGQVGRNYRNLDCLGHCYSCVICSCSEPKQRNNLCQLTQQSPLHSSGLAPRT